MVNQDAPVIAHVSSTVNINYMHYFSYGSNMSIRRLQNRVPSATKVATGILEGHMLRFHKISNVDGSAKCDAEETGDPGHCIYGVVFHITAEERSVLDSIEGMGCGYERKTVRIKLNTGSAIETFTYYATRIDSTLKPLDWYREHVLIGARENALPEDYIRLIEAVEAVVDTDSERRERELSIYRE